MKILFYHTTPFLVHHLGVLLDEAESFYKQGHDVYFAVCGGLLENCFCNPLENVKRCSLCNSRMKDAVKNLSKGIKVFPLSKYETEFQNRTFSYHSLSDIKALEYKGIKIGYAALSSYISLTRNGNPRIDDCFRNYFDRALNATVHLADVFGRVLEEVQPDRVCLFNGRFYEHKPVYSLAVQKGIDVCSYEVLGGFGESYYKVVYENMPPHSIKGNIAKRMALWDSVPLSESEKIKIGKSFFEKRRTGKPTCDKVYIKNQKAGCLPEGWDEKKRNIVIFNSSEDEFSAIGDEYDSLALFPSQLEGIKAMMERLRGHEDIHVYLRVHPNLSAIEYRYHTDLYKLSDKYDNLTVIPATDSVSTYDLMEKADKIVVFGSTTGMEAAYWGKPVILLAGSLYYYTDLCYRPENMDELYKMLVSDLAARDNMTAIKLGFYYMYRDEKSRYKYIDYNWSEFIFLGKKLLDCHYLKILGSSKLYAVLKALTGKIMYRNLDVNQVSLPVDESDL